MNNAVETYLSHIQIHNKSFSEEYNIKYTIDNLEGIENAINNDSRVVSYSKRIILNGMLSNSNGSYGIQIKGVDPDKEVKVTNTYDKIIEGEYFKSKRDNTILVGKKLAERLNLKLKSKVVITFQDENYELTSLFFIELREYLDLVIQDMMRPMCLLKMLVLLKIYLISRVIMKYLYCLRI